MNYGIQGVFLLQHKLTLKHFEKTNQYIFCQPDVCSAATHLPGGEIAV